MISEVEILAIEMNDLPGLADLGKDRPEKIFVRGNWPRMGRKVVAAVVGSRRMTGYGERVVKKMVPKLVEKGFVVVSGLMYGVDKLVHRTCLACGGITVAVLGWGIEERMQPDDEKLVDQILAGKGAVVSEWQKQRGNLWTFPRRDRIVAAISDRIYVVEAAEKSGTLITAEWGIKLKRQVWAVPGPATSPVSAGTNRLIAEGRAKIWGQD